MRDLPAIGAKVPPDRVTRSVEATRATFARIMGGILIAVTLVVWARIVGIEIAGPTFAAASTETRAVLIAFAVLLPVAALGLWQVQSWGRVLWLLAVTLHVVAIGAGWWPSPNVPIALGFHAATVATFLVIELAGLVDRRRTR